MEGILAKSSGYVTSGAATFLPASSRTAESKTSVAFPSSLPFPARPALSYQAGWSQRGFKSCKAYAVANSNDAPRIRALPEEKLELLLEEPETGAELEKPYLADGAPVPTPFEIQSLASIAEVGLKPLEAENGSAAAALDVHDDAEVLIELKNVHKSFGSKTILRGANLKIRVGEAVGIIGPSGTGKSTVLRIMAGLLAPDSGEVIICGKLRQGLISDEESPMLRIGLVFQSAALFDSLTVQENVGFMLYEDDKSTLSDAQKKERVIESLAAVGLRGVEEMLPSALSGGQKKRVALARAIISDSTAQEAEREVVMYDEPTAGLDPIASTVVEDLIRSLHIRDLPDGTQAGKIASYVVVTHQHSTIRRAVDRLLFFYEGKVVWEGTTREFDTTSNPIVRQFADGTLDGPIKY